MANAKNIAKFKFKKGQSGNPKGRPKGVPNSKTRLLKLLTITGTTMNPITKQMEEFTIAEFLDLQMIRKAAEGNIYAYQELMNRLEGKAAQAVDLTSKGKAFSAQEIIFKNYSKGKDGKHSP